VRDGVTLIRHRERTAVPPVMVRVGPEKSAVFGHPLGHLRRHNRDRMETNEARLAETLRLCEQTIARIERRRPAVPGLYDGLLDQVRKLQHETLVELVRVRSRTRAREPQA
jgi:hypothetical protein